MIRKISRRKAILGVSSALLLPSACSTTRRWRRSNRFRHSVASGDPDVDSVVIWTRVSGMSEPVGVDWFIATDDGFENVVDSGRVTTYTDRDYTVKVVARGLEPGGRYFYRFEAGGEGSPVGITRTLPRGSPDRLTLAVVSCSNYPFGYFNAYDAIARDPDVDAVVHLGDYIYEYGAGQYGDATGIQIGRPHQPHREAVTLDDYRIRHAQYKSDPGSMAMHARHPLIVIWDDHESANDPWMAGAENHQPDEGDWHTRRSASLRAWYEWMPVRDPAPGAAPENYWRHYRFGDLASLITLESRHTGRSLQIEYGDLDRFAGPDEAAAFYRDVVGAPDRQFLSAPMSEFFAGAVAESLEAGRRWRIVGNQTIMAQSVVPPLDDEFFSNLDGSLDPIGRNLLDNLRQLGRLGLPGGLDSWSGYPAARARFLESARGAGATDLLVLSGDSHGFWANALYAADGQNMGVELGTTGVTSPRSLLDLGESGLERYDRLNAETNREIVWAEGRYRGYVRLELGRDAAEARYVAVSNVLGPEYDTRVVYTANIRPSGNVLEYA